MAKKQLVLDIGAGDDPQPDATHAIDIQKPEKVPSHIQDYKVQDFQKPPADWRGKFDRVVSQAALGVPHEKARGDKAAGYFFAEKTGKALAFVTKPNATFRANITLSQLKELNKLLDAAGFGIVSIRAEQVPQWELKDRELDGPIVVEAKKGYKGPTLDIRERKELRRGKWGSMFKDWRHPIPLSGLLKLPPGSLYANKQGTCLCRQYRRGWRKIKYT